MTKQLLSVCVAVIMLLSTVNAQQAGADAEWIRPDYPGAPPVWGIRNGIVVGLWPAPIEHPRPGADGGPRGLLRIGYEWKGSIYHINYMAIEPVVAGQMEFSEISPSRVDGKWGKIMWAGDTPDPGRFSTTSTVQGVLTHPDAAHPEKTTLSLYIFMEQFANGAHPYLRISISNDRPEELCMEVFHLPGSAAMERCGITATMGNYSRLRNLYLKNEVVNARKLYAGFEGTGFVEKAPYPAKQMMRTRNGDYIVMAQPDESLSELASWPENEKYAARWSWRYRPFYRLTQYWRHPGSDSTHTLQVRVNGRAKYWSGGSNNPAAYIDIPGGPAYENFELREQYYPGVKCWFGLSRKRIEEIKNME